jgi:redox-sensitive bicupin YhaK (pirin superfamily)
MVQLWVNLPAKDKNAPAAYQTLLNEDIPQVALPGAAGAIRVIAGDYAGHRGPARTFTPINVWDLRLQRDDAVELPLPEGHTALLVVLRGTVMVNGHDLAREGQFVLLDRRGGSVPLEANGDATVLVLSGEPIDEPVVMHGPFVMNTTDEIRQAIVDFQSGRFGALARETRPA